jgi:hypothetical protein
MFRSTNVKTAGNLFIAGLVFSAVTLVIALIMKYWEIQSKRIWMGTALVSAMSAVLQITVLTTMIDSKGRSVCSVDRYAADIDGTWSWYVDYPSALFPYLAYIRFFQSCELGSTGKTAIAGIFFQIVVAVLYILNSFFASCEHTKRNFSIPIVSEVPREDSLAFKKDVDEEAQDQTIEGSYENNPYAPLPHAGPEPVSEDNFNDDIVTNTALKKDVDEEALEHTFKGSYAVSAPGSVPEDNFNDDNISYVNGIEDEIRVEDDLSMDANYEPVFEQQEEVKANKAYFPPSPAGVKITEEKTEAEATSDPSAVSLEVEPFKGNSSPSPATVKITEEKTETEVASDPSAVSIEAEPFKVDSSPSPPVMEMPEEKTEAEAVSDPSAVSLEVEPSKVDSSTSPPAVKITEEKTETEVASDPSAVSLEVVETSKDDSPPSPAIMEMPEEETETEAISDPSAVEMTDEKMESSAVSSETGPSTAKRSKAKKSKAKRSKGKRSKG